MDRERPYLCLAQSFCKQSFLTKGHCDIKPVFWQGGGQIKNIPLRPSPRGFRNEKKHLFSARCSFLILRAHNAMIRQMTLVPKREYVVLLAGDVLVFVISLWLALALRYVALPSKAFFLLHFTPFTILFIAWIAVFFL